MAYKNSLPRSTPEAQGVCSSEILYFIENVEKNNLELHSFMLLRHGYVVSEGWWQPYSPELPHMLFSLSKSFTSTAIGLAVNEGILSVDDTVISFFPEELPESVSENLAKLRIKHLLSMSTGHDKDTTDYVVTRQHGNWVKAFLELPIEHEPGTYFVYNTGATYMLSAIIQKVTGQTLLEYLTPRLFKPLGIEGAAWESCPRGINTGGFGLSIKTEDIAKFGQLYLQKGMWEDKRIIPEHWVDEATSSHISNGTAEDSDWAQGYCYQFWRCRHNAYRGDGAFGQYCIVIPEQDSVIAITSGLDDMQAVLNLIWEHLLPAMKTFALTEDAASQDKLSQKLNSLKLDPPKLKCCSKNSQAISGKTYKVKENELGINSISLVFNDDFCSFKLGYVSEEQELKCGFENWIEQYTSLLGRSSKAVISGTWSSDNIFLITCRLIETPFFYNIKLFFEEDALTAELSVNVSFGPKELPALHGNLV